uniref:Putative secreted protein n=1 Tax=Amblyomma triste TaxID=251400 RepID=A0A023G0A7_AMBTT
MFWTFQCMCIALCLVVATECGYPPTVEQRSNTKHSYQAQRPHNRGRFRIPNERKCPLLCSPGQKPGDSCGAKGCVCYSVPAKMYPHILRCVLVLVG